jgi:hypothetical protein
MGELVDLTANLRRNLQKHPTRDSAGTKALGASAQSSVFHPAGMALVAARRQSGG